MLAKEITGTISSVTIKVDDCSLTLNGDAGLVAYKNSGIATDLTADFNGSINEVSGNENGYFGFLFSYNLGKITNAKVNIQASVTGDASEAQNSTDASKKGNYTIAGIAGVNQGSISAVEVNGSLSSSYVDIGGIVGNNATNGSMTACVNNARLSQTTDGQFWNPNVAGIAFTNNGKLNSCINNGSLSSTSSQASTPDISAITTGIVATNEMSGTVYKCVNNGALTAVTNRGNAQASGIAHQNLGLIDTSSNNGNISATSSFSETADVYYYSIVGGISAINYSKITKCINKGKIDVYSGTSYLYIGGISAYNHYGNSEQVAYTAEISYCGSTGDIAVTTGTIKGEILAGGISGYFAGDLFYSYSMVNISVPEFNPETDKTYAESLCGALVAISDSSIAFAKYNIVDCYYLSRENFNYGVAVHAFESIYFSGYLPIEKAFSSIIACDTLEELKETEVYWE